MKIKKKFAQFVSVVWLVAMASLVTTNPAFAGIDKRTYSDPNLGTTNPNNLVSITAVISLSSNVSYSSMVSSKLYPSARDKIKIQYKATLGNDQTSSALNSRLGVISISQ